MPLEEVTGRDQAVIAGQLGRAPRDLTGVAARCPCGYPAVIETGPVLAGEPNPTLLYVTCPTLVRAISRVEGRGGVSAFKQACREDAALRATLLEITHVYRARRDELAGSGDTAAGQRCCSPEAGIGGPESPEVASCLHAYAGALLAMMSGWLPGEPGEARRVWERFLPPLDESWCDDRRCGRWEAAARRAAIDVGTISVRLLVADPVDGRPRPVARLVEITRLGEGLQPGGPLNEEAKRRTAEVVARFAAEARRQGAESIVLAATSAARDAADGEQFIRDLGAVNEVVAAVLPGVREAQLAYAGATLDVAGSPVVLDIGGGSTEVMHRAADGTVQAVSLNIGASRATERWLRSDPSTAAEMAGAKEEAVTAFSRLGAAFGCAAPGPGRDGVAAQPPHLVGLAGTITTLACLDLGLAAYDPEQIHLCSLTLDSVRGLVARLGALTTAQRAELPCVQRGRAPVLVGGALILEAALETLGYTELTVSERDLLDGLVMLGVG